MKVNVDKSHFLVSGNVRATAKNNSNYTEFEKEQMLLDITIDSKYTFKNYINDICKRASEILNALARVAPYMKRRIMIIRKEE